MAREIPWLDKRDGVYNVFWYEPPSADEIAKNPKAKGATKRFGLRTRDAAEAQARYAAFLVEGKALVRGTVGDAHISVSAALDDYFIEHVKKKDAKGRNFVADPVRAENCILNLKAFFGETPLPSVDITLCEQYADARRAGEVHGRRRRPGRRNAADSTIRRELGVLQAAAKHSLRRKRIKQGDMPTFEKPKDDMEGQEPAWFTKVELALLFTTLDARIQLAEMTDDAIGAKAQQRLRDWIEVTYAWGARRASIEKLTVQQVNLDTGRVNLQKAGERVTRKRRPIVPLYASLRPTLTRLVENAEDGFLFGPSADFYGRFVSLCLELKLRDKAWPHVLRHSRATHMLMDGENPYKVAKLIGDTLQTLLRVYGHHCPEFLDDAQ